MPRVKQILIRVSDDEHKVLEAKARIAGVSIPALIRGHLARINPAEHRTYLRLESLHLARISLDLDCIAEDCHREENALTNLEIITRLIAIERQLQTWKEKRLTVCS